LRTLAGEAPSRPGGPAPDDSGIAIAARSDIARAGCG
jgi:hypothetical protein